MEAGSQAFWLMEPGIGARRRVARFMLIRASGAQRRAEEVARTDPGHVSSYGETPEQAAALAAHYGLGCEYHQYSDDMAASGGAKAKSFRVTPNET